MPHVGDLLCWLGLGWPNQVHVCIAFMFIESTVLASIGSPLTNDHSYPFKVFPYRLLQGN